MLSAGRLAEAVGSLKEALRLDPADRRALHRLGELYVRLKRPLEAAGFFAAKVRCEEREGLENRAIASWRLAPRCDPAMLEGYERIGAAYASLGRLADARLHYERSAQALRAAGRRDEAAILAAHLAALEAPPGPAIRAAARTPDAGSAAPPVPDRRAPAADPSASAPPEPDDTAAAFAADRMQCASLFHLMEEIRQDVERALDQIKRKGGRR